MASSSSSSRSIPASLSQSWNYDVFLSFRGEDTRKNFVDHLYAALVQQGIHTYKDDETLPRGDSIGPSLLKAIQESRVAVVVLSENYANSSWCLDELTHIMDCMDKKGQIVMPVFYEIDPSDVRKQNGRYGESLAKHELENKKKVEIWKKALVKAGNLSGWVTKDFANGHEAKCIKDITGAISSKLILAPVTNHKKDLIGIETRLQDLKTKMEIGSGGVRMVGIWGVGGGGKTTLAHAAYSDIYHEFEAACFLENIRDESSKHGLKKLQENFLSSILKTKLKLESEIEGKSMIERRLCHKVVLVVLDDVDDHKQLQALAGSHNWFGVGSRIIFTTRNEHLLTRKADLIYEVSLLSHDEATKLFNKHAYREEKPVEDYETLSLEVVSYAGGLPLALEVLGSFLYDKDKVEWMGVLAKLKDIPHPKVIERLKISYDGLEPNEKELFLDIACFLRKWNINEAMMVLDACSFYPRIGVKVLIQKSLIKISNGKFDMHDLIEEMARYIVKEEHSTKHSRIWKEQDITNLLAMEANPSLIETEVLDMQSSVRHSHLPDVVANMNKLRWIRLKDYETSTFSSSNFHPTNLGCLMLTNCKQKRLWKGYKRLPGLKILDLSEQEPGNYLTKTPDFKDLPCLERLNLRDCHKLKEIHPSIGYHESLVWVSIKGCRKLKRFPPIIRMRKLETLILSWCRRLRKFPLIQTNMDSLECLHLDWTDIEMIPPTVGQLCTNLVTFNLSHCFNLRRIEGNFRLLKRLKYLDLYNCFELEQLAMDFFDEESSLEVLNFSLRNQYSTPNKNLMQCIRLQSFHQDNSMNLTLYQLPRCITKLSLSNCNLGDGDIPCDISELVTLQVLDLSYNKFSRLHSSLSRIPCLKHLKLSYCESLVELPDLPSSIAILEANFCDSLESIGDLSNCKWLWKVSLWMDNKLIDGERVLLLHSMLQVNAVEDRFMNVLLPSKLSIETFDDIRTTLITMQLPFNWYDDFSGFILHTGHYFRIETVIVIKGEMSLDSQYDQCEEFDENWEPYNEYLEVGYVPFGSLRHTSWWNSTYTQMSFQIHSYGMPKVKLVPRKSKPGDSREATTNSSDLWDEDKEDIKTFEIIDDSNSSKVKIVWCH